MTLFLMFYPYHFVRTILSINFVQYHFVHAILFCTILSATIFS